MMPAASKSATHSPAILLRRLEAWTRCTITRSPNPSPPLIAVPLYRRTAAWRLGFRIIFNFTEWTACCAHQTQTGATSTRFPGTGVVTSGWSRDLEGAERDGEPTNRRLCPDRRLWFGRAGRPRRFNRLALPPAIRFGVVFRGAARRARSWPLADRPGRPNCPNRAALSRWLVDPRNPLRDAGGCCRARRFHAAAPATSPACAPGPRFARARRHAHRVHPAFRLRRGGAVGRTAAGGWPFRHRRARAGGIAYTGADARRGLQNGWRIRRRLR